MLAEGIMNTATNAAIELEAAAAPETVEHVVFGYWRGDKDLHQYELDNEDGYQVVPTDLLGVVLPWSEARQHMTGWRIAGGFGGAHTHALTAYTESRVFSVCVYDGATWLVSVPRNPVPHMPELHGGG